jgi:AcrR family transcriptional regulator
LETVFENIIREHCSQTVFYTMPVAPSSRDKQQANPGVPRTTAAAAASSASLPPAPRRVTRRSKPSGRRTGLSVEAIVAAAIAVLDESGVAGLSMRRVAERLDTGAASLYAYVAGKDELLELVFDELIGAVPLPEPDANRWREQLHQMLLDLRNILTAHRDAALAGLGRVATSPKALAASETLVGVLRAGGLSDRTVGLGIDQLILYVSASAFEDGLFEQSGMTQQEIDDYFDDVHAFIASLPGDRFPVLTSLGDELTGHDADERFKFGLDVLIAGLEAVDRSSSESGH